MSILKLLGLGTNWNHVNKIQEKAYLERIARIVHSITCLMIYDYDMNKCIHDLSRQLHIDESSMSEEVYKVIKGFGTKIPTRTEYNKFDEFSSLSDYLPTARKVKKYLHYQEAWDIACQWAKEYDKQRSLTIINQKNERIKELELEVKQMEMMMKELELKPSSENEN